MIKNVLLGFVLLSLPFGLSAKSEEFNTHRFAKFIDFTVSGIVTPKVVEYETTETLGNFVLLQETKTGNFLDSRVQLKSVQDPFFFIGALSRHVAGKAALLGDRNLDTAVTFDPNVPHHEITLHVNKNVRVDGLNITLDNDTFRPKYLTLEADFGNGKFENFIDKIPYQSVLKFSGIYPKRLKLKFITPHFLRVNEISLTSPEFEYKKSVIFYAEEGKEYRLWYEPHFGQSKRKIAQVLPLEVENDTLIFSLPNGKENPLFISDFDEDGLPDTEDLCPKHWDPSNKDLDKNKRGDMCEDPDQDNLLTAQDNCPFTHNPAQKDSDNDEIGDKCDDHENRFTENESWIMTCIFALVVILLIWLIAHSIFREQAEKESQKPTKKSELNEDDES